MTCAHEGLAQVGAFRTVARQTQVHTKGFFDVSLVRRRWCFRLCWGNMHNAQSKGRAWDVDHLGRDTSRISTRFFCVKNMSRCVKYQGPGEGVGVGFCHSCHIVKMRQKHPCLLEYARGPHHNVHTDTSLVLDHTYQRGPSVIK